MAHSSNPNVTMNKDYVEYGKHITELAMEALQVPKHVPGWEQKNPAFVS